MANISGIGNSLLDSLLPRIGFARVKTPIWNESQRMFITDQYTSAAGHTYYLGVRFTDRFVTVMHIGLYHNWTYINEVELYVFNEKEKVLVGKTQIDQFYNEGLIRSTTEKLMSTYIEGQLKLSGKSMDRTQLDEMVVKLVDSSYCSLLDDPNTVKRFNSVITMVLSDNNNNKSLPKKTV